MPSTAHPSDCQLTTTSPKLMPHQVFCGTTWHSRLLPAVHKFAYPYRYWGVNISALAVGHELPEVSTPMPTISKRFRWQGLPLFSATHRALQQFYPDDYLQPNVNDSLQDLDNASDSGVQALEQRLRQTFIEHTGSTPLGDMIGMVVCRNAGVYFSPVNFYLGFDEDNNPSHLLAEVSNTPWNKRHYYGFLLDGADTEFCHDKSFHVSPFNPIDQQYRWQVSVKKQSDNGLQVRIAINISDVRGDVLKAGIKMSGVPMTANNIRHSLRQNPLMNISSLTRIYWHAFKLYAIKKVPYINYDEKLADGKQQKAD